MFHRGRLYHEAALLEIGAEITMIAQAWRTADAAPVRREASFNGDAARDGENRRRC